MWGKLKYFSNVQARVCCIPMYIAYCVANHSYLQLYLLLYIIRSSLAEMALLVA